MTQVTLEKRKLEGAEQPVKRARPLLWIGLEFVIVLVIGLLLLEPIVNWAGVGNEEVLDIEPSTGWTLMPNRTFTYRKEGYSQSTINSHGMRDVARTIAKPANTYRIAVLGCSITEGNQVPVKDTYCSVLERKLNENNSGKRYEVLNFAVSAYTLGQEYLRMKNLALSFQPDIVVFTVRPNALLYMGPDQKTGFYNSRPVFGIMPDGRLIEDRNFQKYWLSSGDGKRMQSTRWLRYNSRLWGVIGKCSATLNDFKTSISRNLKTFVKHPLATFAPPAAVVVSQAVPAQPAPRDPNLQKAQAYLGTVADAIIEKASNECKDANCKFVIAYMPATKKHRDAAEEAIIRETARKHSIDYFDFNQPFDQLEAVVSKPLYIVVHPSKLGHERMADELYGYLTGKGMLR